MDAMRWFIPMSRNGSSTRPLCGERFLTGPRVDPQTWRALSDQELQFLANAFSPLPSYRQSRVRRALPRIAAAGEMPEAVASARKAVNYERRYLVAWETLLTVQRDSRAAATLEAS